MTDRDWTMDDVVMVFDGGYMGIYDGWIAAELKDGRIVNRWDEDDNRFARTQEFIDGFTGGNNE
jgi:hypothetical protein